MIYKKHFRREIVFNISEPGKERKYSTYRMWHIYFENNRVTIMHAVRRNRVDWIYLFMKASPVSGIDLDMNFDTKHWFPLWLSLNLKSEYLREHVEDVFFETKLARTNTRLARCTLSDNDTVCRNYLICSNYSWPYLSQHFCERNSVKVLCFNY